MTGCAVSQIDTSVVKCPACKRILILTVAQITIFGCRYMIVRFAGSDGIIVAGRTHIGTFDEYAMVNGRQGKAAAGRMAITTALTNSGRHMVHRLAGNGERNDRTRGINNRVIMRAIMTIHALSTRNLSGSMVHKPADKSGGVMAVTTIGCW